MSFISNLQNQRISLEEKQTQANSYINALQKEIDTISPDAPKYLQQRKNNLQREINQVKETTWTTPEQYKESIKTPDRKPQGEYISNEPVGTINPAKPITSTTQEEFAKSLFEKQGKQAAFSGSSYVVAQKGEAVLRPEFAYTPKAKTKDFNTMVDYPYGKDISKPQNATKPNNRRSTSSFYIDDNNTSAEQKESLANQVYALREREKKFYGSEGFKRIEQTASFLTFGSGKSAEERGLIGRTAQQTVSGLMSYPISLGGFIPSTVEKLYLFGKGWTYGKEYQENIKKEFLETAPSEALKVYSEPSTYTTAAVFAFVPAAGRTLKGEGGFGTSSFKVRLGSANLPGEEAPTYSGLYLQTSKIAKPLIGISDGKPVIGTPKLDLTKADLSQGFIPETTLQARIIEKSLPKYSLEETKLINTELIKKNLPGIAATSEVLSTAKTVVKATETQSSAFKQPKFTRNVEAFKYGQEGVTDVLKFTKKEGGYTYGSFPSKAQSPTEAQAFKLSKMGIKAEDVTLRTPGDIDVMFSKQSTEQIRPKIESELLPQLKSRGNPFKLAEEGTLIETVSKKDLPAHAVDIHTMDTLAEDIISPAFAKEQAYGFKLNQPLTKIEMYPTQRLSEQGVRKFASIGTVRELNLGNKKVIYLGPETHRVKDIGDFFSTQRVLLASKKFRNLEAEKALDNLKELYPKEFLQSEKVKPVSDTPLQSPSRSPTVIRSSVPIYMKSSTPKSISRSPSIKISPSPSPSFSKSISVSSSPSRSISPSISKSPNISPSSSMSLSPSKSPSPSKSQSPSKSPSPSKSLSPSPSPSKSPSPYNYSSQSSSPPPPFPISSFSKSQSVLSKAFRVFLGSGKKEIKVGEGLTRGEALKLGSSEALKSIKAKFRIEESGVTSKEDISFAPSSKLFKESKTVKGQEVKTPNVFIQKRGQRLFSKSEVNELQSFRRLKQATRLKPYAI